MDSTMSLAVRKSSPVVVRPPLPGPATARGTIKLSPLDKEMYRVPNTALLLFEDPLHNSADNIQAALSRILVLYYHFSGRIIAGASTDDDVYIDCINDGVQFVAASASYALKEVLCFDRSPGARKLLDELAMYYPAMSCGSGDPLLLMQVTEFSCGGFVLGVTWNHGVADGAGMGQFLQALGEIAAGGKLSPSVAPVRWDDSLHSLPPSVLQVQEHIMGLQPLDNPELIVTQDLTFSVDSIDRIRGRADFSSSFHALPCTTFEAVLAVLWQCRTRAIRLDPETPILLVFVADIRKHVDVRKGYYGNCGVGQLVMAKSGAVADGDLKDVIMAIKHAKDQIPVRLKEDEGMVGIQQELCKLRTYDTLTVTSWRNLGFDQVDFGSGRPARVTSSGKDFPPFPSAAGFLSNGKGGVSLHSAVVWEEHADAFLAELAKYM